MRVTANTFPNALVDQLSLLTQRQANLQNQAATGQKIQRPEDNPVSMQRILDLQSEARLVNQYRRNTERLQETATATYEVMRGIKTVSDRAGEIAVRADGTKSDEELKLFAVEVTNLIRQAVQVANTQFRGNHLLSGTQTDQPPFVLAEDANGVVTGVTFQGNLDTPESEIGEGATVSAHSIGANTTGAGPRGVLVDSRYGADFFNHLISLQDNLLAGDTDAIQANSLAELGQDEDNLLINIGQNASLQARLETNLASVNSRSASLEETVSNEADADLTEVLVRLNQTETAYRAALQSGASLLSQNLLDYLR